MDAIAYAIIKDRRLIRLKHFDLDDTWWMRGMSPSEIDMQKVEDVLQSSTGLSRIFRRHNLKHSYVEFRLRADVFNQAAVALRLTYNPDPYFEKKLMEYPD